MDADLVSIIRRGSRRLRPVPAEVRTRGTLPRTPRAVLFDVYGTLLQRIEEASPHGERRVRKLVSRHGLGMQPQELRRALENAIAREHARLRKKGIPSPEVRIERIWRSLFPAVAASELRRVIVQYELAVHPCWPMPGGRRLIAALARRGIPVGIISNAQFYTPLFLSALLGGTLEDLGFSRKLCFYSWMRGHAKPSVRMFEEAVALLEERGIPRRDVLFLGNDLVNDVGPAARTGFMTIQVCADGRSLTAEPRGRSAVAPDAVISRLSDLPPLLVSPLRPERHVDDR